jgi:hypothetical protein
MLSVALVASILASPAHAAALEIAPSVKQRPAVAGPSAPKPPSRPADAAGFQAALTAAAAQDGGEPVLDGSLVRVMSSLLAEGRCAEAVGLASRDGRKALAARARQYCE